jgi:small subunit ribosomal protein S21
MVIIHRTVTAGISYTGWGEGVKHVTEVTIGENESFEAALKRFNKKVQQSGILSEIKRREHYEKPSVKRKKKEAAKRRKSLKNSQR